MDVLKYPKDLNLKVILPYTIPAYLDTPVLMLCGLSKSQQIRSSTRNTLQNISNSVTLKTLTENKILFLLKKLAETHIVRALGGHWTLASLCHWSYLHICSKKISTVLFLSLFQESCHIESRSQITVTCLAFNLLSQLKSWQLNSSQWMTNKAKLFHKLCSQ